MQQQRAASAQDAAAKYNSKILEGRVRQGEDTAAANAGRLHKQKQRRLSAIRAKAAGSGVTFTGSVLDTYTDEADFLEQDIQTQVYQAQGATRQGRQQTEMTRFEGGLRYSATRTNANASLISSLGSVGSAGYDYSQQFGPVPTRT